MLLQDFMSEFGTVVEAKVVGSQRFGFVTYAEPADAQVKGLLRRCDWRA